MNFDGMKSVHTFPCLQYEKFMSRQVDTLGVDVLGVDILRPTQTIYNSAMPFAHWDPKKSMRFGSPSVNCFFFFFFDTSGDVAGQFTAPPPTFPGVTFTFRCTVTGSGSTQWRVNGSSNLCTLPHVSSGNVSICTPSGASHPFTATPESGFGTSGPFTSTLSATADPVLDGTLVECFGPGNNVDQGNRVGNGTIQIVVGQ